MIDCPVCGMYKFEMDDNYEICKICKWENDGLQMDEPNSNEGANFLSLNQARDEWRKHNTAVETSSITAHKYTTAL